MLRSTLLAAFLLVSPSIAFTQVQTTPGPQTPTREEAAAAALEEKAYALIETLSGRLENLQASNNRVRMKGAIADLLWARDENRARDLFRTAAKEIKTLAADFDFDEQTDYQQVQTQIQLRQEIINRVSARDAELALEFVRATRLPLPNDSRWSWYVDNETNIELNLAGQIAGRNPQQALEIARANMKRGVRHGANSFLSSLTQHDPKSAQVLYRQMVDLVKREDLRDQNLNNAAWSMLAMFQPPTIEEAPFNDLIDTLVNSAQAISPADPNGMSLAQGVIQQITHVLPQIEKFAPARAGALRQWTQDIERHLDPWTRMNREVQSAQTVEDLLNLASKYSKEMQNNVYQHAAWKAFSAGDVNRAREIVNEHLTDPVMRRQMLEQFDMQLQQRAAPTDKTAQARQRMSKTKNPEEKAKILMQLAAHLMARKDTQGALNLLNEAATLVPGPVQNSERLSTQVQLARMYASLDVNQSFAIMQPLIGKTNELVSAAIALDGFENRYLDQGEWLTQGGTNTANLIVSLQETLAAIGPYDFDRAVALSEQMERPEIRLISQLQIAQGVLQMKSGRMRKLQRMR